VSDALRVSAPASSANLGPGFDCLALALELRNEVEIRRGTSAKPVVRISGEGAGEAPTGADNLFLRAFERGGADVEGLEFEMTNRVPFARGLGGW
jgi:homoserine kinase